MKLEEVGEQTVCMFQVLMTGQGKFASEEEWLETAEECIAAVLAVARRQQFSHKMLAQRALKRMGDL